MKNTKYPNYKEFTKLNEAARTKRFKTKDEYMKVEPVTDKKTGEVTGVEIREKSIELRDANKLQQKAIVCSELIKEFEEEVEDYIRVKEQMDSMKKTLTSKDYNLRKMLYKWIGMSEKTADIKPEASEPKDRIGIYVETLNYKARLIAKIMTPEVTEIQPNHEKAIEFLREVYAGNKEILNQIQLALDNSKELVTVKKLTKRADHMKDLKRTTSQYDRVTPDELEDYDVFDDGPIEESLLSDVGGFFKDLYLKLRRLFSKVEYNLEEAKKLIENMD